MDEQETFSRISRTSFWSTWWEKDYSWNGLRQFRWQGWDRIGDELKPSCAESSASAEASLQDYFRYDPSSKTFRSDEEMLERGLLVDHPGLSLFHVLHLPVQTPGGEWTWKADPAHSNWQVVEEEMKARLAAAGTTVFRRDLPWMVRGCDHRAQFQGAILTSLPKAVIKRASHRTDNDEGTSPAPLHLMIPDSYFSDDARFSQCIFGNGLDVSGAYFDGTADFGDCKVLGSSDFGGAMFRGRARFYLSKFAGNANFARCQFGAFVKFGSAKFAKKAHFSAALFLDKSDFRSAQFLGDLSFENALFVDETDFRQVWFSENHLGETFDSTSRFVRTTFRRGANFSGSKFSGITSFEEATFHGVAIFGEGLGGTISWRTGFEGTITFRSSVFERAVLFCGCSDLVRAKHGYSALAGAVFEAPVDFRHTNDLPLAAFDGADLRAGVLLDEDQPKISSLKMMLEAAQRTERGATKSGVWYEDRFLGGSTAAIEGGCRMLKHAMARVNDTAREHLFYKFELIARSHGPVRSPFEERDARQTWTDRLILRAYGAVSDYGNSVLRPLLVWAFGLIPLLMTLIVVALTFYAGDGVGIDEWARVAGMVWTNAFVPFHAWGSEFGREGGSISSVLLMSLDGSSWFALQVILHLQSVLTIGCLFLSGLALRRRFQLS